MSYNGGSTYFSAPLYWLVHGVGYVLQHICFAYESLTLPQLLAYALAKMTGIAGYDGWRWIFIIEGLATIIVALVLRVFIVDWPETSKFLNDEERSMLLRRIQDDSGEAKMDRLDRNARRRAFGDWKIYVGYGTSIEIVARED